MPTYKLQYFNIQGRAEIMRLMFAEAGVEYTDDRINPDEWGKRKDEMPFKQMPVLVVDGEHKIAESGAIYRFLARELKLGGESSVQEAYVDMLSECFNEIFNKMPFLEQDPDKKKAAMDTVLEKNIVPTLTIIENKFKSSDRQFLVGKSVTYADMQLMQMGNALDMMAPGAMDQFPALGKLRTTVANLPKIKAWIAKRPKTDY